MGVGSDGLLTDIDVEFTASTSQGRDPAEIRHVAGREQQRARPLNKAGQCVLQVMMRTTVSGHQVRRTTPGTEGIQPPVKRRNHLGMICQAEIVIAAE